MHPDRVLGASWALRLSSGDAGRDGACTVGDLSRFGTVDWRPGPARESPVWRRFFASSLPSSRSGQLHFKVLCQPVRLARTARQASSCRGSAHCIRRAAARATRVPSPPLRNPSGGHSPWALPGGALGRTVRGTGAPVAHVRLPSAFSHHPAASLSLPCCRSSPSVPQPPHHHHTEASATHTPRPASHHELLPGPGVMSDATRPASPT